MVFFPSVDLNMTLQSIVSYLDTFSMWIQMSRELDGFLPHIHLAFNRLWFMQTLVCIFYCIRVRRFFPVALNSNHFAISQFNIVLITNGFLYLAEIVYTQKIRLNFNSFLHHIITFRIFIFILRQQTMICFIFLIPYLLHSLYWCFIVQHEYLLWAYNISIAFVALVIHSVRYKNLQLRIPTIFLLQTNLFTYFYDGALNLHAIDISKLGMSLFSSCLVTMLLYFCVLNLKKAHWIRRRYVLVFACVSLLTFLKYPDHPFLLSK